MLSSTKKEGQCTCLRPYWPPFFSLSGAAGADEQPAHTDTSDAQMQFWMTHPQRTARAVRAEVPPRLDGVIDDEIWLRAPVHEGFTQNDPDNGEPSTQRTTFQVAYDDDALYIAGICYDTHPDSITTRLARRDEWRERDLFEINLDPHHDHQTGVYFVVGPSGWIGDGIIYNDDDFDDSWDSVAEVKTARRADGWSLELKIPYHVLRFGEKESYTWGINVFRKISRRAEWSQWSFKPRGVSGYVSRFGHLEGIEGIRPQRSLEIFPLRARPQYPVAGRQQQRARPVLLGRPRPALRPVVEYLSQRHHQPGLRPSRSRPGRAQSRRLRDLLSASAGPSFWRASRSLNRRTPFIVGIRRPTRLFHSRRIGRPPSRFDLPEDSNEVDRPDNNTILGAVKVSGKTAGRTAFGLLNAVTGREEARIDQRITSAETGRIDTLRRDVEIEPITNYFIGRVQQDLLTNSTAGAQLTAVNGRGFDPAYVGAGDLHVKWWENAYRLYSRLAISRAGQEKERDTGWEGALYFQKTGGAFGGQAYVDAQSPGFEANDLGFMRRNDRIQAGTHIRITRSSTPTGSPAVPGSTSTSGTTGTSPASGCPAASTSTLGTTCITTGDSGWASAATSPPLTTWPLAADRSCSRPPTPGLAWTCGLTTASPSAAGSAGTSSGSRGGDNLGSWVGLEIALRPVSQFELGIEPGYNFNRNFAQWVENKDEDGDGEDDHFIFGELESRVFEIGVRVTWAFTPSLSSAVVRAALRDNRRLRSHQGTGAPAVLRVLTLRRP